MNSTTAPFSKMTLALVLSVSGMLLSLSALAIATNDVKHELQTVELHAKDQSGVYTIIDIAGKD
jgi:hypothetical protein